MAHAGDKPATERRIHVLPVDLLERVRAYQAANAIPSEVEAVRRLLSEALQARDTIDDIMKQVQTAFKAERDLRAIARDILSGHILVSRIDISDGNVTFALRNGDAGTIGHNGEMKTGSVDDQGWISTPNIWPPPPVRQTGAGATKSSKGWEAPGSDLDEEIPF